MKKLGKGILLLILAFVGFFILMLLIEIFTMDRPFSWHKSYQRLYHQPYDCSLVFNELEGLFPDKSVKSLTGKSKVLEQYKDFSFQLNPNSYFYDYESELGIEEEEEELLDSELDYDTVFNPGTAFIEKIQEVELSYSLPEVDKANIVVVGHLNTNDAFIETMLLHVYNGNDLLIASEDFSFFEGYINVPTAKLGDSVSIITNANVTYDYKRGLNGTFFSDLDYPKEVVKAHNSDGEPVLLKFPFGSGNIILSSTPVAFTNYYLLKGKTVGYMEYVFNKMTLEDVYWAKHRMYLGEHEEQSELEFLKKNPPLWWAYLLAVITMIVYMLLGLKRKQKLIPGFSLPQNSTIEFVRIMAQLHLQNGNNEQLFVKIKTYFFEHIRKTYYLSTAEIDDEFINKLIKVSLKPEGEVRFLFRHLNELESNSRITNEELITLHKSIKKFKS